MTESTASERAKDVTAAVWDSVIYNKSTIYEIIATALRAAEAKGQHDEHRRWVKKFPSASPPQGGPPTSEGAHMTEDELRKECLSLLQRFEDGYTSHDSDLAALMALCQRMQAATWRAAGEDLAHGLPLIWRNAIKERCEFKAKWAGPLEPPQGGGAG